MAINIIKCVCSLLKSFNIASRIQPLVTLGHAIEPFSSRANPTLENMFLADRENFTKKSKYSQTNQK